MIKIDFDKFIYFFYADSWDISKKIKLKEIVKNGNLEKKVLM